MSAAVGTRVEDMPRVLELLRLENQLDESRMAQLRCVRHHVRRLRLGWCSGWWTREVVLIWWTCPVIEDA
jgi:hypothetical protein